MTWQMVSSSELNEYWALLNEIDRLAKEDLVALWRSLDVTDRRLLYEGLIEGVPEIIAMYRGLAADTAMLFYSETQGLAFTAADGRAASEIDRVQLRSNLQWAVFGTSTGDPLPLVAGILTRHVVDGARNYAMRGFEREGEVWVRAARENSCNFCRMLATRAVTSDGGGWGTPYTSAAAAAVVGGSSRKRRTKLQKSGSSYHNNCKCLPVRKSSYEIPDYVHAWTDDYFAAQKEAKSSNPRDILAHMRRISGHNH